MQAETTLESFESLSLLKKLVHGFNDKARYKKII